MQIHVGDTLLMKKQHPCGENRFLVLRAGMDLKLRCVKCGRELESPRSNIERHVKKILPAGEESFPRS